jgi:hypothetical protein
MEKRLGLRSEKPETDEPRYSGLMRVLRSKSSLPVSTVLGWVSKASSGSVARSGAARARVKAVAKAKVPKDPMSDVSFRGLVIPVPSNTSII